jgi:transcriptional regulator with XRE-family HTH domain
MNTNFSINLARLRKEKKVSQKTVAKKLGVSQALLSHYENGVREPGIDFLLNSADYYGCSVDFLLGRTMDRSGISLLIDQADEFPGYKPTPESKYIAVSKKLLLNSVTLLAEIIKNSESKELMDTSLEFLQLALYRLFRVICAYGDNPDGFFSVPFEAVRPLTDALFKLNEYSFLTLCSDKNRKRIKIEYEDISGKYPVLWQSLISIIEKVDSMMGTLWNDGVISRGGNH